MHKEWFEDGEEWPFESITIRVPCKPHKIAEVNYGKDYMTPKPFTGLHDYPFYKVQEEAFSKMWAESGNKSSVEEFCANWHKVIGGE